MSKDIKTVYVCELLEIPPNHEFMQTLEVRLDGTNLIFSVSEDAKSDLPPPSTVFDPREGLQE